MPGKKHDMATEDRRKSGKSVPLRDRRNGDTHPLDPANPASKPHGTTNDQISEMEGEGQAQAPGQDPPPNADDE